MSHSRFDLFFMPVSFQFLSLGYQLSSIRELAPLPWAVS